MIVTSQKNIMTVVFTILIFFVMSYSNVILSAAALSNNDSGGEIWLTI